MKRYRISLLVLTWVTLVTSAALAQPFQHVILIVQENRTPDNLFYELCASHPCSTSPDSTQYNIQTSNWLNKKSKSGYFQPFTVALASQQYDPGHNHGSWKSMCDWDTQSNICRMDGAVDEACGGNCPANFAYGYIDNSSHVIDPYLALATQYGWANYMFGTNQGPSYPAHQFLFGATAAPSASDDAQGTFVAENTPNWEDSGCASSPGTLVQLIDSKGGEDPNNKIFPCFEHETISDILEHFGFTWRYYTPSQNSIWTAPNSIDHICVPNNNQQCTGSDWSQNVDLKPADVLTDIASCKLRNMSWVVPTGQNSDHPLQNTGGGPSWVASIVNAIGTSNCKDGTKSYWDDTAIIITWDDWGGWYDHVPPTILKNPQGGYQYGFRVPLIVVSAYTPQGYISNTAQDFGAIARFIEHNFLIKEGYLNFADARTGADLLHFFDFTMQPRTFTKIPAPLGASHFINDKTPPLPPDDD